MSTSANRSRARAAYRTYTNSTSYSLYDVYNTFSRAKADAWRYCENLRDKFNGHGLKVLTANTFTFTAGFEFEDRETGVCMFMYITPNYDTAIEI